jgi:RND family efflux transporter MFP subunit
VANGTATNGSGGQQGSTQTVAEATASVQSAQIALDVAEAQRDQATITAPISGTVAEVDFSKGSSMSTSDKIVITGTDTAMTLAVDISQDQLSSVSINQKATVGSATGVVTAIGLLPSSDSSASDSSYPVTITIADPPAVLAAGASATAKIATAEATDAIRVPVSAVSRGDDTASVLVLDGEQTKRVQVKIGAVGSTMVEITSGLKIGQTVVIADRSAGLPSSEDGSSSRRSSVLGSSSGGFGGAGGMGSSGGFGAGGPGSGGGGRR